MTKKRKHRISKRQKKQLILELVILFLATVGAITLIYLLGKGVATVISEHRPKKAVTEQPELDVELLSINKYSRPGTALEEVNAIVIHYTANPGSTAIQNRNYFEGLKDSHETMVSSHFVVGLEGEIVQCIPTSEVSYASNNRNEDTIAIECCHMGEDGKFEPATYDSLVELTAFLLGKFNLTTDNVIRHYDVTGKKCPLYYVEHEDEWEQFKKDVDAYIDKHGQIVEGR
ncbi:MAG: peptidoglycan recognition family protein [Lachnospiraceae bacterium]|nr:peptidoglycan recognition family protein [Lachnospiraceae bacterium]